MRIKQAFYTILVVTVVVGIALVPWLDGYLFKQNYLMLIETLNKENNANIKVVEYRLGWFGSYARLEVDSQGKAMDQGAAGADAIKLPPYKFTIEQTISHGPIVHDTTEDAWSLGRAMIHSDVTFPQVFKVILSNQSQLSDLQATTLVSVSGDYGSAFSTPSFYLTDPTATFGKITWAGMRGSSHLKCEGEKIKEITSNIIIGGITSQGGVDSLTSQELSIQSGLTRLPSGLWSGTYGVSFPGFLISNANGPFLSMTGLSFASEVGMSNKTLYDSELKVSLNSLSTLGYTIKSSTLKVSEKNIDANALINLLDASAKMLHANDVVPQQYETIYPLVPRLITPTTVFNHDIRINTSTGKLISTGQINWPRSAEPLKSMEDVVAKVIAKMHVQISVSLVNSIIDQIYNEPIEVKPVAAIDEQVTEKGLLDSISQLKQQQHVDIDVTIQLKDLVKTHLDNASFASNIDNFVTRQEISPEIAAKLKTAYAMLHPDVKPGKIPPVVVAPVVQKQLSPADMMKQLVTSWVQQGYIKTINEDYITDVTYENGVIKMNGLPLQEQQFILPALPQSKSVVAQ